MPLAAQTYSTIETIIVDNASTDGSQEYIRANFPDVTLIELDTNTGFTGACNTGIKAATGDLICLLNNDTEVDPNWGSSGG
jgi:GT2 family glycosyltransferase